MPTEPITLVHPERKDTLTVSTAAARTHRKAGWMSEDEAVELAKFGELSEQDRAVAVDFANGPVSDDDDTADAETSTTTSWTTTTPSEED